MLASHLYALLAPLHDSLAAPAAARLCASPAPLQPHACLVRLQHAPGSALPSSLQIAPLQPTFVAQLQASTAGAQALQAYLAQALDPGSAVRTQLARSGWLPDFTALVQTVQLPAQPPHSAPVDALMVLLCSASLTLPVFHRITTDAQGQRHCILRSFPSLREIHTLQPLVQSGHLMHAGMQ